MCAGCPRVLYLDYQPSGQLKGSGPVRVDSFTYAGHPTGLMKQKELETSAGDVEALYLSQDIGMFVTSAVKKELAAAGYTVASEAGRTVSGTIEHFFLDYVGADEQRFQIRVVFSVAKNGTPAFTSSCRANRQQVKDWMKSGLLIERGTKDCLEEFLHDAQTAGAL
jgi:hypothetical protein